MPYRIVTLLITALLSLATLADDSSASRPIDPDSALTQANALYEKWQATEESKNYDDLVNAISLYNIAEEKHAHDYRFQLGRYLSYYALAWRDPEQWQQKLKEIYASMDPLFASEVTHPNIVAISNATSYSNEALFEKQLAIFQRTLQENPYLPHSWYLLSKLFETQEQYTLALEAAKIANNLVDESLELSHQMSMLNLYMWEQSSCEQAGREYALKSLPHLVKANTLSPQNTFLLNQLAQLYQILGLFPMATNIAEQAVDVEANGETLRHAGASALLDSQYEKAAAHYITLINDEKDDRLYYQLAKVDLAQKNTVQFVKNTNKAMRKYSVNALENLLHYELLKNIDPKEARRFLKKHRGRWGYIQMIGRDPWERATKNYLTEAITKQSYFGKASNNCEKGSAHFFHGLRLWNDGINSSAVCALQRAKRLLPTYRTEYSWTSVLLDSELIESQQQECGAMDTLRLAEHRSDYPSSVEIFLAALEEVKDYRGNLPQKVFHQTKPYYPSAANETGGKGYAVVEISINERGTVEQVTLKEEHPADIGFGISAVDAARKLLFFPAVANGKPVAVDKVLFKFSFAGFKNNTK